MPGKVTLAVIEGPKKGDIFPFEQHDTFLCGRMSDNHVSLPKDELVSRHHCILEINPPNVRIRDLGSLNGTFINEIKYGGRSKDETPEEGAKHSYPTVDLQDGDKITIGLTTLLISIEIPDKVTTKLHCQHCNKDVTIEAGQGQQGTFICSACRQAALSGAQTFFGQTPANTAEIIPGYQLLSKLGTGGTGVVYLVRHIKDGHEAALKVLLPQVAVDEEAQRIFLREIQTTRKLRHRHIVRFIEGGIQQGAFYCVLEYCKGGNVYDLMLRKGGKLTLDQAGPIMLQTLEGLAYAHSQEFIHRDLKPHNILLAGKEGQWIAKIGDMGLAKNFEQAGLSGYTITDGSFAGTAGYMPREQIVNFRYIKPVSDVWAIGATYYHMLTGSLPRVMRPQDDIINMILYGESTPIRERNPHIPPPVAVVIDRALLTNETERYQNAGEMHNALLQALQKTTQ